MSKVYGEWENVETTIPTKFTLPFPLGLGVGAPKTRRPVV